LNAETSGLQAYMICPFIAVLTSVTAFEVTLLHRFETASVLLVNAYFVRFV